MWLVHILSNTRMCIIPIITNGGISFLLSLTTWHTSVIQEYKCSSARQSWRFSRSNRSNVYYAAACNIRRVYVRVRTRVRVKCVNSSSENKNKIIYIGTYIYIYYNIPLLPKICTLKVSSKDLEGRQRGKTTFGSQQHLMGAKRKRVGAFFFFLFLFFGNENADDLLMLSESMPLGVSARLVVVCVDQAGEWAGFANRLDTRARAETLENSLTKSISIIGLHNVGTTWVRLRKGPGGIIAITTTTYATERNEFTNPLGRIIAVFAHISYFIALSIVHKKQ